MKTYTEVLDRAQLCMLLCDRGWCEETRRRTGPYPKAERVKSQQRLANVLVQRGLDQLASESECQAIFAPVGSLTKKEREHLQWQWEALPMLMWSIGHHAFPAYDGSYAGDFHEHSVLFTYRVDDFDPTPPSTRPSDADLLFHREVARLWHWRVVESLHQQGRPPYDVTEAVLQTFGPEYVRYLEAIPRQKEPPHDFMPHEYIVFYQVPKGFLPNSRLQFQWLHHAIEWVVGEDTWAETKTEITPAPLLP